MSWIKDNKFLVALGGGTLVGAIVLYFIGAQGAARHAEAKEKFDAAAGEASGYERLALYPRIENKDSKNKALNDYRQAVESIQSAFAPFRPQEIKNISPQEFTNRLLAANAETRKAFEDSGTLVPEPYFVGFERYKTSLAPGNTTGVLDYQLSAIKKLMLALASVKPTELKNLHRPSVPEEDNQAFTPPPNGVARQFPLEITFTGTEKSARDFLSTIVKPDDQYIVIRSLRITNMKKDPPKAEDAKFEKPAEAKSAAGGNDVFGGGFVLPGEEPAAATPEAAPAPTPQAADSSRILAQVLGTEQVMVFCTSRFAPVSSCKEASLIYLTTLLFMSWISKNYEKAALGGAAVIALGIAYLGFSKYSDVEAEFNTDLKGKGNNNAAVSNADLIPKALSSMKLDRSWLPASVGDREVDLFTGIALFVPSAAPDTTVDPRKDPPIHEPIPNTWWLTNRLDPGFADSPARDPDEDGFSNIEEFQAKTDPNDGKSIPSLIAKLMYVRDESLTWVIRPSYGSDGKFPFNYLDTNKATNKTGAADMVGPNELFFAKEPMKNRFKFLGSEVRKEMNTKTNIEVDVTYVRIEDQRANKKGTVYEFPAPLSEERINEHQKFDRTAVFSLEALGLGGQEFKVEENTKFALPPGSPNKDYLLKTVTPGSVVVEYPDPSGATKSVEINKGSMPSNLE